MDEITDFTSYNEVRSTVGLSIKELPDSELSSELYVNRLEISLASVTLTSDPPGPGPLQTRFLELLYLSTRTGDEQLLYNLTRLFATYSVALEAVVSLSMKAPKQISESKASLVRFSPESAYKDVIAEIKGKLADTKSQIESLGSSTVSSLNLLRTVAPTVDPVTGA